MTSVGQAISRVRNVLKIVKEDAFITDRSIYSIILKYAKTLMEQDNRTVDLFKNTSLFKELPCMELKEVDRVEACCGAVKTACMFMRTKYELPEITSLSNGPLIRSVMSIDNSLKFYRTEPHIYSNLSKSPNFKYNKTKYYWIVGDHMFFPNFEGEAVKISAMFEDNISLNNFCDTHDERICIREQDKDFNIPEKLFSAIEKLVHQEMLITSQLPTDGADDNQNILR